MRNIQKVIIICMLFAANILYGQLISEVRADKDLMNRYTAILDVCNIYGWNNASVSRPDNSGGDEMFRMRIDKKRALPILLSSLKDKNVIVKELAAEYLNRLAYAEAENGIKESIDNLKIEESAGVRYTYDGKPWDGVKITREILQSALYKIEFSNISSIEEKMNILEKAFDNRLKPIDVFDQEWGYYQLGNIGEKGSLEIRKKAIAILEARKRGTFSASIEENITRLKALDEGYPAVIKLLQGIKITSADNEEGNKFLRICALGIIKDQKMIKALHVVKDIVNGKTEKAKKSRKVASISELKESIIKDMKNRGLPKDILDSNLKDIEEYYNDEAINKAIEEELMIMDGPFIKKAREVIELLESLPKEVK